MAKNTVTLKVDLPQLRKTLQQMAGMGASQSEVFLSKTIRAAVRPMVAQMKQDAPTRDNDNLVNNVGIKAVRTRRRPADALTVGVVRNRSKSMKGFSPQALASAIEYGTPLRVRKSARRGRLLRAVVSTGKITAPPQGAFLRPAFDDNAPMVEAYIEAQVIREVERAST